MGLSWRQQKRRVERLSAAVEDLVAQERQSRSMLRSWSRAYATRYETIFWAGVTGFVFLSRRRGGDEAPRHNLLVELGLAAWVVQRWRKLPGRVEASIDRARQQLRAAERPRTPAGPTPAETMEQ
jgi:hypothetical protein